MALRKFNLECPGCHAAKVSRSAQIAVHRRLAAVLRLTRLARSSTLVKCPSEMQIERHG